jgi:hypothetical protein
MVNVTQKHSVFFRRSSYKLKHEKLKKCKATQQFIKSVKSSQKTQIQINYVSCFEPFF